MEYTKFAVVQLLLLGSALAQQQHFGFGQQQQQLRQPQPFQQQNFQQGFQPSGAFGQQQQQQFQQPQQRLQQAQRAQQPAEQFSTFGEGVESFKQINNRPVEGAAQPAAVQTRSQFAPRPAAGLAAQAPAFQQQPIRAAPVAAPAAFRAASAPAAAPAPVELPNAVGAPAEQHDAQVFTRRPLASAPVQVIPTQQAEALRVQQENERLQAETLRIQQENARIKAENQRIQQENLRFRQEGQQQQAAQQAQQAQPAVQQESARFQQTQHQLQEFINQQDAVVPQQEVLRAAPVAAPVQPTRSRGLTRRPVAVLDAAPKPVAAPVRVAPVAAAANPAEEELFEEQAKNAQYTFASSVDDKLTDNSQIRQETRDGLNLAGLYSYSDGFFRRTVHYEADENGYRVVKEEVEPIGNGPQLNPNGAAEVQAQISGQNFGYRITADDIKERKETEKVPVQQRFRQQEQDFSQ